MYEKRTFNTCSTSAYMESEKNIKQIEEFNRENCINEEIQEKLKEISSDNPFVPYMKKKEISIFKDANLDTLIDAVNIYRNSIDNKVCFLTQNDALRDVLSSHGDFYTADEVEKAWEENKQDTVCITKRYSFVVVLLEKEVSSEREEGIRRVIRAQEKGSIFFIIDLPSDKQDTSEGNTDVDSLFVESKDDVELSTNESSPIIDVEGAENEEAPHILRMPANDYYVAITAGEFLFALSFCEKGRAHLCKSDAKTAGFDFTKVDVAKLCALYSVIEYDSNKNNNGKTWNKYELKISKYRKYMGYALNGSKDKNNSIKKQFELFSMLNGKIDGKKYPVIKDLEITENTVIFRAPYLCILIKALNLCQEEMTAPAIDVRIDFFKNTISEPKREDKPYPIYTYAIRPTICTCKSIPAKETAIAIAVLIERANKKSPHISHKSLMNQCPIFKAQYEMKYEDKILKRTYEKMWELLENNTILLKKHKNLTIPPHENATPSKTSLDRIMEFKRNIKKDVPDEKETEIVPYEEYFEYEY